ncbi:hypothetical protein F4859DRAFT_516971 [Xylaria cf. heliscus]|nr:hypothetical protein F4859DRAFT_516971 [Xylaria cf. heliscus]
MPPEDIHGLGNPLADPKDAVVDIIFVHGLNGSKITTWTSDPNDENPTAVFWPKDLLPSRCPNARILSFGYNASIAHFYPLFGPKHVPPTTTIDNHSTALIDALVGLRNRTNTTGRPLIFIAHSLGGLVCANAVSKQLGVGEAQKELVAKLRGMIFLGTPFAGCKKAVWAKIAATLMSVMSTTNVDLIKDLEERSKALIDINNSFSQFIKARDRSRPWIELACYYEKLPTYVKKASVGFVVDQTSSTLPGISPIGIEKSHASMSKFDGDYRPGFISISDTLCKWIQTFSQNAAGNLTAGGINTGSAHFHAPIQNNRGVISGTIFSTQKDGLTTHNYAKRTTKPKSSSNYSSDQDDDGGGRRG